MLANNSSYYWLIIRGKGKKNKTTTKKELCPKTINDLGYIKKYIQDKCYTMPETNSVVKIYLAKKKIK